MQQMASKGQQPQVIAASSAAPLRPNMTAIAGNRPTTIINGQSRITPHHILTNKNLTIQEQQILSKQIAQQGRIVVSTGQVTPGMRTAIQPPIHGIAGLTTNHKGFLTKPQMGAHPEILGAGKDKPRNTGYSSAVGYV